MFREIITAWNDTKKINTILVKIQTGFMSQKVSISL
jgi:hypothetical protein